MYTFSTLPEVIVSSTTYISYISYYRHIQADLLLRDREDQQSSGEHVYLDVKLHLAVIRYLYPDY